MEILLLAVACLAALVASVPVILFARRRPGFSHVRQTISELGEAGARDERKVAFFAFAPAGHAVWLYVAVLALTVPALAAGPGLWLLAMLGLAYVAAAIFPCDPGAPLWGSWRNNLHNLFAGLGYFGWAAGMIEIGRTMEDIEPLSHIAGLSQVAGQASLFGIFLLSFPTPVRGLVQRLLETLFFGWLLLVAVVLVIR